MTLRELKDFMTKLPAEMDDFMVVNGEMGYLDPEDDNSMVYRVDNPIVMLYVDEQTQEVCMFHQTQEDVKQVLKNNQDGNS
jgi:phage regulator Rha-like protein